MKKYVLALIATVIFTIPASSENIRQLQWVDLVPADVLADDPLQNLSEDQLNLVHWVINALETLPKRSPETEEYYKEVDKAMPALQEAGIDIVKLMAKIKQIQTSIVKELNGQKVRIPGYLLPLEVSATKVTEFLLVPYVGACIHVPPPPPNQIVHVKIIHKEGYTSKGLFDPVWVTGVISVQSLVKDLFLVDGTAGVEIGYSMQAGKIEPYDK